MSGGRATGIRQETNWCIFFCNSEGKGAEGRTWCGGRRRSNGSSNSSSANCGAIDAMGTGGHLTRRNGVTQGFPFPLEKSRAGERSLVPPPPHFVCRPAPRPPSLPPSSTHPPTHPPTQPLSLPHSLPPIVPCRRGRCSACTYLASSRTRSRTWTPAASLRRPLLPGWAFFIRCEAKERRTAAAAAAVGRGRRPCGRGGGGGIGGSGFAGGCKICSDGENWFRGRQ